MAIEDEIRDNKATNAENQKLVNDLTNKAITAGKIAVIEGIVSSLPAPVNFAARALGEGLHAAFKVQPDAILQPADGNQDAYDAASIAIFGRQLLGQELATIRPVPRSH
ncbi:MAG: hypothetical protein EBU08_22875 [Micrococcales bacterium]|nr:hypothetical protein [Micrococcales bacterium]